MADLLILSDNATSPQFLNLTANSSNTTEPTFPLANSPEEELELGIMSEATMRMIETVVNAGILPVLVVCGVIGNVINMAVFVRQGLGDRINLCLFSLAVSDTGFILVHLASRTFIIFYLFDTKLGEAWQARAFSLTGVYIGFLLTSNMLTLVISLQRCIIVVSPLSAKRLPSARQMAAIIVSLYALCFLGTMAYSFRWLPGTCIDHVTNVTHECIQVAQFVQDNMELWNALIEIPFNTSVPLVSLAGVTVANVIIAVRMRSVLAWRKETAHVGTAPQTTSSTSANQREAAMTKMLLILCVIYSICSTPTACQAIARQLVPDFVAGGRYNNIFYASLCISHLLESVNCSVNFVIYYTMSSKFNETLRGMFSRAGGGGGGKKGRKEDTRSVLSKNSASETDNQTVASLA